MTILFIVQKMCSKPYHHEWANTHDVMNFEADVILEMSHKWDMLFLSKLKYNKFYLKSQHFGTLLFSSGGNL